MTENPPSGPSSWFNRLYVEAAGDPSRVPWASRVACPIVAEHLDRNPGPGRAIVVGCSLGDDSEAVAAAGYDTVAFDVSPAAIGWCRRRFPNSVVAYRVAHHLKLPAEWRHGFDLVVEVRTVQSLPPAVRPDVLDAVASLVASGGRLLLVALARAQGVIPYGPPWAVSERELQPPGRCGPRNRVVRPGVGWIVERLRRRLSPLVPWPGPLAMLRARQRRLWQGP